MENGVVKGQSIKPELFIFKLIHFKMEHEVIATKKRMNYLLPSKYSLSCMIVKTRFKNEMNEITKSNKKKNI